MHLLKKISFTLIAAVVITLSAKAQKKTITPVEIKKTSEVIDATTQSLSYTLPKTVVEIAIESEKVIKKVGPYYRYSQRFLNLSNVITEDSEEWVVKGVNITTVGTPDEEKRYSIFSSGNTSASNVSLNEAGILVGFNSKLQDEKPSVDKSAPINILSIEDIDFDDIPLHEDLLYKTSTAAMAQEAANMIYKIRNNRIHLLSGELENLPPDGEAYKTVLNEMDKMEKAFVSLFAGKTVTISEKQTYRVTPDPLSSYNNHVVCRFSKQKGLVDAADITGTPIYFKLELIHASSLENKREEALKDPLKNGLFYCLPATATVTIVDKNKEVGVAEVDLAQYGQVVSMPASVLVDEGVVMEVSPVTGALLQITKQ